MACLAVSFSQEVADGPRNRSRIAKRNENSAALRQQLLRVPIRCRNDRLARTDTGRREFRLVICDLFRDTE